MQDMIWPAKSKLQGPMQWCQHKDRLWNSVWGLEHHLRGLADPLVIGHLWASHLPILSCKSLAKEKGGTAFPKPLQPQIWMSTVLLHRGVRPHSSFPILIPNKSVGAEVWELPLGDGSRSFSRHEFSPSWKVLLSCSMATIWWVSACWEVCFKSLVTSKG